MFLRILGTFFFIGGLILLLFGAVGHSDTPRMAIQIAFAGFLLWAFAILFIAVSGGSATNKNLRSSKR